MNATLGWALAALAIALGYAKYGWQGALLGITVVVFWLLLQFSRSLRLLRTAAQAPKGQVPSAVMLNAKLQQGMRLPQVLQLTRSLGDQVTDEPEVWRWTDAGQASVELTFERGRLARWSLQRPPEAQEPVT